MNISLKQITKWTRECIDKGLNPTHILIPIQDRIIMGEMEYLGVTGVKLCTVLGMDVWMDEKIKTIHFIDINNKLIEEVMTK